MVKSMRNIKFYLFIAVVLLVQSGVAFSEDVLPSLRENIFKTEEFKALPKATGTVEVRPTITAIELQGNFTITEDKIREAIFSRIGDSLYEEKIKLDLKAIYAIGYFSDVNVHFYNYKGGTKVVFEVVENPTISEIRFEGNAVYPADMLKGKMKTKEFEMLNYQTLRDDIDTINKLYKDDGYMVARVIDVSTDELSGVLTIKMVEGTVEKINIEGNEITHDYVILREFNTKPGGILNEKVLSKDLRRVFNLGFFQEISPTFQPGSSPDKIVIVLNVKESRTSSINFGGGFGEKEGWFGFIDLSVNNLFGTGRGLMIRGQSGQKIQTYQFRYSEPWVFPSFFGDHATSTFRKWVTIGEDIYFTTQNEIRNGFDVSLSKPFGEDYSTSFTLGSEQVSPYQDATFEAYRSDTIGFTFSYDTRDFWLNPSEGSFNSISTKWGWKQTSVSTSFQKYMLDFNQFIKLADKQTLAMHLSTGIGYGDVPDSELFWCGGAYTVRGWYPADAHTGAKKLIMNIEYRYTFNEMFQGVIFEDFGNAWDSGFPQFHDFLSGWGAGLRINTPMGPIRLDYGIGGGKAIGEGIIHFTIGQAF